MDLAATVYFDFESADSWRFFLLCMNAEAEGAKLDLTWVGLAPDLPTDPMQLTPGQRAVAAHAAVREPTQQRTMRQALFTMRHRQGDSLADNLTYRAAARVAGMDDEILLKAITNVGLTAVRRQQKAAEDHGVVTSPTLVAGGPSLHVVTNDAVMDGPARPRIAIIAQMLSDDGLWRLEKP